MRISDWSSDVLLFRSRPALPNSLVVPSPLMSQLKPTRGVIMSLKSALAKVAPEASVFSNLSARTPRVSRRFGVKFQKYSIEIAWAMVLIWAPVKSGSAACRERGSQVRVDLGGG